MSRIAWIGCSALGALFVAASVACAQSARLRAISASVSPTPNERQSFMTSLVATPVGHHRVRLTWTGEPGTTSYIVLRAAVLRGPYVTLTPRGIQGTSFEANGIPATPMVFRVIALRGDHASDTTSAAYVTIPEPAAGSALLVAACQVRPPSTLSITWERTPDADLYAVRVINDAPPAPRTLVDIRTRGTRFTQSGLPAGRTLVRITAVYALPNFPAVGDTARYTRNAPVSRTGAALLPVSTPRSCD
jgi:hypothetical protein